jgi:hypothetical protein
VRKEGPSRDLTFRILLPLDKLQRLFVLLSGCGRDLALIGGCGARLPGETVVMGIDALVAVLRETTQPLLAQRDETG